MFRAREHLRRAAERIHERYLIDVATGCANPALFREDEHDVSCPYKRCPTTDACITQAWPWETQAIEHVTYSIPDFLRVAHELAEQADQSLDHAWQFVRLAMAGRLPAEAVDETTKMIDLNPLQSIERGGVSHIQIDIDSVIMLIGEGEKLDLMLPLDVFFVQPAIHAIRKRNAVRVPFENGTKSLHHVPNFCIGKVGRRGKLVAVLPGLHTEGGGHRWTVPNSVLKIWYDVGLLPALTLHEPALTQLPFNFAHAKQLSSDLQARPHKHAFQLPGHRLTTILNQAVENVSNLPQFRHMLFVFEFRGTKGKTAVPYSDQARLALVKHLTKWIARDTLLSEGSKCWIDLGFEFYKSQTWMRCRTSAHPEILRTLFPEVAADQLSRGMETSSFITDYYAQMEKLGGFRWEMSAQYAGAHGTRYLQCYHTDKVMSAVTGHETVFSQIYGVQSGPDTIDKMSKRLKTMRQFMVQAVEEPHAPYTTEGIEGLDEPDEPDEGHENGGAAAPAGRPEDRRLEGAVRIEARIPLKAIRDIMPTMPTVEQMERWFVSYEPSDLACVSIHASLECADPDAQQLCVVSAFCSRHHYGSVGTGAKRSLWAGQSACPASRRHRHGQQYLPDAGSQVVARGAVRKLGKARVHGGYYRSGNQ
jgi:hypothetical protein